MPEQGKPISGVFLDVEAVTCTIGGVTAVRDVTLRIDEGELVGIVGPNGAGKTTLFNTITGFARYQTGDVRWLGSSIRGWKAHKIAAAGLGRTFQNIGGFSEMTVRENLSLASRGKDKENTARLASILGLDAFADREVNDCSLATRKLVGIGTAVVQRPRMLLLDEPLSGLDGTDREAVVEVIRLVRDEGVTVLLIEHDIDRTLALVDRIAILDTGSKVAEGSPESLVDEPELHRVYLTG